MFKKKNLQYNLDLDLAIMFDFCDYLSSNAYAIPGLFNYKLKSIGKLFHKNGFIEHTWNDDIIDGKQAMEQALYYYDNNIPMNDIEYYNYIDVKVMQEIVYYFKNKIEK